jgi:CRP-like cAMP-binding protein
MHATLQADHKPAPRMESVIADRAVAAQALHGFPHAAQDALGGLRDAGGTVVLERDQELHEQGSPARYCYQIVSGCLRTVKLMEDGRRQIGDFLMAGDLLGFDVIDNYSFGAEAVTGTVLRRYKLCAVENLADNNPGFARWLRQRAARHLQATQTHALLLGRKSASERIAAFLMDMAHRSPRTASGTIAVPMCRVDIADHLGLTIETVCRNLTHLHRAGTITLTRGTVEIRDQAALEQLG